MVEVEIIFCFGVTKTPSERPRAILSFSFRSVYKPFSSPEDEGSMFL
jgi:hypothetical protein